MLLIFQERVKLPVGRCLSTGDTVCCRIQVWLFEEVEDMWDCLRILEETCLIKFIRREENKKRK